MEILSKKAENKLFLTSSAAILLLKVVSIMFSILTTVILARILGPTGFGQYSFVLAVASVATLPAYAGISTLAMRETAAAYATQQWGLAKGVLKWTLRIALVQSLFVSAFLAVLLFIFSDQVSSSEYWAALWGIILIPTLTLSVLRTAFMRGIGEPVKGISVEALVKPGVLIIGVSVASVAHWLTPATAIAWNVVSCIVAICLGFWWFQRLKAPEIYTHPPEYHASIWWRSVGTLALLVGSQQIIKYTDIILLGLFTTASHVGQYRIAVQAADITLFVLMGITMVLGPRVAALHATGDYRSLQRLVTLTSRISALAALLALLMLLFMGEWLIRMVFGINYEDTITPLLILATGQLSFAWFGISLTLLKMTGQERASLKVLGLAAIVNALLNIALIPLLGMIGAALATAITLVWGYAMLSWTAYRLLGLHSTPFRIWHGREAIR
ncbi:polysaccharide biosynthesis C-terminal domain-containing protein [Desulfobotulus mexicanus]|uniref:oligosaccharide flippase family protein n=1 Tax=Desulfobotulus mexicanus TaxID=2586642 RepID=UPI001C558813|nr:polysaccharide biosynthesis C-terminal domain-containing protein [Desulfobotulus mexicanus]